MDKQSAINYILSNTPLTKTWMANALGMTLPGFNYALERGLKANEIETLEIAIKCSGAILSSFTIPKSLHQEQIAA